MVALPFSPEQLEALRPLVAAIKRKVLSRLKATYDAAATTNHNEDYWANATYSSPFDEHSPQVRRKLLARSRYEYLNGSYTKGIIKTLSNDFVGSGPKLQITDSFWSKQQQNLVERVINRWTREIKLRRKLKRLRIAKCRDGEAFGIFYTDLKLQSPIKLNFKIIECDHCVDPFQGQADNVIDGIRFDEDGEPEAYYFLFSHPQNSIISGIDPREGRWVKASLVIHWFDQDRPYHRGVPETAPMLPLASIRRRYTLAVLSKAEILSDFAVLLESDATSSINAFLEQGTEDEEFDQFPVDKGMITVLPRGKKAVPLDTSAAIEGHDDFVNSILKEESRCVNMPHNIASGNSGGYNFASGTLDRQLYHGSLARERDDCEDEVLTSKLLPNLFIEIGLQPQFFGATISSFVKAKLPDHTWRWDALPQHADPQKEANARSIKWKMGEISDRDVQEGVYSRDVEEHYTNLEEQQVRRSEINAPVPENLSDEMIDSTEDT